MSLAKSLLITYDGQVDTIKIRDLVIIEHCTKLMFWNISMLTLAVYKLFATSKSNTAATLQP